MNAGRVDQSEQQTSYQVRDGFAARQQRESFSHLVFTDQFANERLGARDDECAGAANDDGEVDEPTVSTVGHHRQTDDLEHNSDDGKTEVVEVEEMNETGKKNGRGQTETGVVGG